MEIKVLRKLKHQLLLCSTESSTGKEMRSNLDNDVVLYFMGRLPVQTDLFIDNTKGYEAQIRRESRLALKNGITVLNSPGAIDADYRGEVCNSLVNLSKENFVIRNRERICQMVIAKNAHVEWVSVGNILSTGRGSGGFDNTCKKLL